MFKDMNGRSQQRAEETYARSAKNSDIKFSEANYQEYLQLKATKKCKTSTITRATNSIACFYQSGNIQSPWIIGHAYYFFLMIQS